MMKTLSQLPAKFMAMSMTQRFGLLAVSAMAVAVVVVGLMWATAPKYQYLFTDLNEQDASLVVQHLKDGRISYRLAKGGTAIMIPEKSVYETRLTLAAQGIPKGGVGKGFALFDESDFSTSEFVQKINYQRALQNELANTIMSLEEVDFARVHIAMPKESIFIEDEKPAKASIVIKTRPGMLMGPSKVQGIVYLVEKSIRGLDPENISIVDIKGRVLYEGKKNSDSVIMASDRLEFKRAVETQLQERAQDLLERIVGPNAAVVKVSADVNMDMVKSVQDMYDPEVHVIRSEELKDQYARIDGETQGAAGTTSNLPTGRGGAEAVPAAGGRGNGSIVRNYEIGRNQTEHIQSPGSVKKLTVSVVVDGTYKTDQEGNKMFVARQASELKEIENAVKNAVGFDIDREDLISVSCMPFAQDDTDLAAISAKEKNKELIMTLVKYALFFLLVILVLLLVIRPLLTWLTKSVRVVERVHARDRGTPEERELLEGGDDLPQIEAVAKSDEMKRAVQGKRKTIEHITKNDMNTATAVVKSWLQENA
ncbi:MAG TPA: flagellar basal-body MS-ring/collar protein FliF [Deltaproteobacteria bacterium]|jgi:flagellar M-ring protein FliF|nr:flagellar M-ring protein FliF [Deltaproteobacteria bacterium]HRW80939.1 flagellar basal-body MS-ring/collar protein FliF [Desulfomonilia bacterium]NMD39663.1 flagellar M-ring protein FliF [Deltaproteobacteria bacterium]HNQ84988.1 flagellar basal-body MS-ring/collar protein FliF [Deltaproteobacteria bacterium]HNS88678.1 flagellar basal-body MS-ring/collar protein FliF [Deltaproteobacteria bacterium]